MNPTPTLLEDNDSMTKTMLGLMLSATVAMAAMVGCQSPASMGTAPGQTATTQQQATAQDSQATAQAMGEERETDNYGYLADDAEAASAGYAVFAAGGPKAPTGKGGVKAAVKTRLKADVKAKVDARRATLKAKAKGALDKLAHEKDKIQKAAKAAAWVDNGDGTESKTLEFSVEKTVNGQASTRVAKMVRTRTTEDKALVSAHYELTHSQNGITRSVVRDKVLQEDGSYQVTFHSEMTFKDGSTRVADFSKTITADGAVTGTGTIAWTGKMTKTVTVTFGGTEEAETATTADPAAGATSTVTTTADGTATATTTDTATGTTATTTVTADVDAAVATEATASPAPTASPGASASRAAAASPASAS
jgi:hypothetical protein